jgi:hypothetical protein
MAALDYEGDRHCVGFSSVSFARTTVRLGALWQNRDLVALASSG